MTSPFKEISPGFFTDPDFTALLSQMKLDSIEAVFAFEGGSSLIKANLASWRTRIYFQLPDGRFAYLKRYNRPPVRVQIKNWIQHRRRAFLSDYDCGPAEELSGARIATPRTLAFGGQYSRLFEKRSFIISLEIPDGQSLEKRLPECFRRAAHGQGMPELATRKEQEAQKKAFILKTADLVRRFHQTGFRHRDLYLAHLFLSGGRDLYLIDLHRCFKPVIFAGRYAIKDLAQLYYSCPADRISWSDRLRFFLSYRQHDHLTAADKRWIGRIHRKAVRMARHDRRHGRTVPFERTKEST